MPRKSKFTKELKIEVVRRYEIGKESISTLANEINANEVTVRNWIDQFHEYGESAFNTRPRNESYAKEFKEEVVNAYLNGTNTYRGLALQYNIPSHTVIIGWVKEYNNPEGLKEYCPQGDVYQMKSRKTTQEERIEIVNYCLNHNKDYKLTAKVFSVPYANIYSWVQKYLKEGKDGLGDRRGHHKSDDEVDKITLLKRQLERVERERDIAQMENRLLKKVEEIERRRFGEKVAMKQNIKPSKKR